MVLEIAWCSHGFGLPMTLHRWLDELHGRLPPASQPSGLRLHSIHCVVAAFFLLLARRRTGIDKSTVLCDTSTVPVLLGARFSLCVELVDEAGQAGLALTRPTWAGTLLRPPLHGPAPCFFVTSQNGFMATFKGVYNPFKMKPPVNGRLMPLKSQRIWI